MSAPGQAETSETPTSEPARSPVLEQQLERATIYERRRALRALLKRPLLSADAAPDELNLVRRHAVWLRQWLSKHPGWRLQVDSELARLHKTPADLADGTRPARDPKSGQQFTRRRYVLLCLALAALERSDRQTTLGKLAETVMTLAASDPALGEAGMDFNLESRGERGDLVQVVRLLLDLRVLVRVQGDESQFLKHTGDVLYNIRRPTLAAMLSVQRGPSTLEATDFDDRLRGLTEQPFTDSDEGRNRRIRSRLTRQLLDDPLIYYEQLEDDELAYMQSQRPHLVREIRLATGLRAEARQEGLAMVDERGDLTDLGLPEEGTDGHLTLLLAEFLADHGRRRPGSVVGQAALERQTARLIGQHKKRWRKDVTRPQAEKSLTAATLERLQALGLVRRTGEGVVPLPAIGRFSLDVTSVGAQSGLLFEDPP